MSIRGDQISDIPGKPPPDLRTEWTKSLGNFGSASTSDALRDFLKKKNVFVVVIVVVIVVVVVIVIDIRPSFDTRHVIYQSRGLSQTITVLISARLAQQNAAMRTRTHFKTQSVSLVS